LQLKEQLTKAKHWGQKQAAECKKRTQGRKERLQSCCMQS
jgi:hypothetical protein